jgi:exodeoxyribonuclease VII large subunit
VLKSKNAPVSLKMNSFDEFSPPVLQVSQLTHFLRELIESEQVLQDIWIAGEISNYARAASGHLYFTLKDQSSSLKCVVWKGSAMRLRMNLRDGMAVEAHGAVSVYEGRGECQLVVDALRLAGEGAIFQEFLRRKAMLESEGLFDTSRKRPIPDVSARIGVVTSPTGAAFQDILNTLERRYPFAEVILSPATVQGEQAPKEIIAALRVLDQKIHPDVIILARGGGSLEDLWAFNDEEVVRAVASFPIPIVTGIGHETDFTLCDFAADLRAPTPTAAAEQVSPDIADFRDRLGLLVESLSLTVDQYLSLFEDSISIYFDRLMRVSPRGQIDYNARRLDELASRWQIAINHANEMQSAYLANLGGRLAALDPQTVLRRGFAVIRAEDGTMLRSISQVKLDEQIQVEISDGRFGARVNSTPTKHDRD